MACHGSVRAGRRLTRRGDERAAAPDGSDAAFRPVQPRPPDLCRAEAGRYRAAVRKTMNEVPVPAVACLAAARARLAQTRAAAPPVAPAPPPLDGEWRGTSDGGSCNAPLDYRAHHRDPASSTAPPTTPPRTARCPTPRRRAPPPPTPGLWQIHGARQARLVLADRRRLGEGPDRREGQLTVTQPGRHPDRHRKQRLRPHARGSRARAALLTSAASRRRSAPRMPASRRKKASCGFSSTNIARASRPRWRPRITAPLTPWPTTTVRVARRRDLGQHRGRAAAQIDMRLAAGRAEAVGSARQSAIALGCSTSISCQLKPSHSP